MQNSSIEYEKVYWGERQFTSSQHKRFVIIQSININQWGGSFLKHLHYYIFPIDYEFGWGSDFDDEDEEDEDDEENATQNKNICDSKVWIIIYIYKYFLLYIMMMLEWWCEWSAFEQT